MTTHNRGIDHLVLCVHDLEAARARYRALGFTVTPVARHPWGTANSLVQLQGNFLELLAIADDGEVPSHSAGGFSFGAFNRDFLARREGCSMLVFHSADARADQREFAANGLAELAAFDFSRKARLPDGSEATVAFTLAFVARPELPEAVIFTCQQHAPQYFWKPEYQAHANGALRISEVVMTAPEPGALEGLFVALQGTESVVREGDSLGVHTALGRVCVVTPEAFAARFPGAVAGTEGETPRFAAFRIELSDLERAETGWRNAGLEIRRNRNGRYLAPEDVFGVAIELVGPSDRIR